MPRILPFLLLAGALIAQGTPPPPPEHPVKALRLKVDPPPSTRSGLDLDPNEIAADLKAFLASRGLSVVPEGKETPEGTFELEISPITLRYPEGTCLLSVRGQLAPVPVKKNGPGWGGSFMAAQAGEEGLVYQTRSVILELADFLLRRANGTDAPPAPIPAPSFNTGDPSARQPPAPQPAVAEVPYATVQAKVQPPPPPYPALALERKVEGTVIVLLTLDPDGRPARAIAASGPLELKPSALRYAMQWIFQPVKVDGKPAWVRFRMPLPFRLFR